MKKFSAVFLAILLSVSFCLCASADLIEYYTGGDDLREFASSLVLGDEWKLFALQKYGVSFDSYLQSVENNDIFGSSVERQRIALACLICGKDMFPDIVDETAGKMGIMSYVFALHLINNGAKSVDFSAQSLAETIISLQNTDGGFGTKSGISDIDTTAMAIQALAAEGSEKSYAAIGKAVEFLSTNQLESGGFKNYGKENPESASQVIIALSSIGIDTKTDERFIKNGNTAFSSIGQFMLPDGSYCHTSGDGFSSIATVQVLCAEVAYKNIGKCFWLFEKVTHEEDTSKTEPQEEKSDNSANNSVTEYISEEESRNFSESVSEESERSEKGIASYKYIFLVIAVLSFISIFILLKIRGKVNKVNIIILCIVFALIILIICFVKITSPDDYYGTDESKNICGYVTISIKCDEIKNFSEDYIPKDGIIAENTVLGIADGDTVYDCLVALCRKYSIQLDVKGEGAGAYVAGIGYIYEAQYGEGAGWAYTVNGIYGESGCGSKTVKSGDVILWYYTESYGE